MMTDVTSDPREEYTKLSSKVKRGSGTRDQDTTKVVTRHHDPATAVEKHREALAAMREVADMSRTIQPDQYGADETEDDDDE